MYFGLVHYPQIEHEGLLSPYLREDLPFYPHIGLGLFSQENYDFDNPTASLSLDREKYQRARKDFEDLGFATWCNIDSLTLVWINAEYTKCEDLREFTLNN